MWLGTIITNAPGPQVPTYAFGALKARSYSLGCIMGGMGLFHSVTSYDGGVNVTVTACRQQMPGPTLLYGMFARFGKRP
ncbi:MAG: diacylglycerol O-acyltransferase [Bermanella sp.]|jgi:diacylglycerol O-acyltransferase